MLGKKNSGIKDDVATFIGANAIFEGNIELAGTIRIDGKIKGDLNIEGDAYIGTGALVTGNVFAKNVHAAGTVEGNIHADGILKILSTARIYGDIEVKSFVTDEGAIFEGKCSMIQSADENEDVSKSGSAGSANNNKRSNMRKYRKNTVVDNDYKDQQKNANQNK